MRVHDLPSARIRARQAGEKGPAILLCVDPPNVLEHYGPLIARLKRDARVAVFEPAGFGHSRGKKGFDHSWDASAKVVEELLSALGWRRAILAFPCVSAYVAMRVAARRPDLVAGLCLMQAPSWEDEARWADRVDRNRVLRTPVVGQAAMLLRDESIARQWYDAALPDEQKAHAYALMATEALSHGARFPLATAFQAAFNGAPPELSKLDAPALLVWGGADKTHRKSDPAGLAALLPRAKSLALPEAGHFPELEQPVAFADALLRWAQEEGIAE